MVSTQDQTSRVLFLANVWHEDDVWNFSATDLPLVAYGETLDQARTNFQEAVVAHLQALSYFGEFEQVVERLRALLMEQSFYERVFYREFW